MGKLLHSFLDPITLEEIRVVLPFGNRADLVEVLGAALWEAFEHSVSGLPNNLEGRFLQVSGLLKFFNLYYYQLVNLVTFVQDFNWIFDAKNQ